MRRWTKTRLRLHQRSKVLAIGVFTLLSLPILLHSQSNPAPANSAVTVSGSLRVRGEAWDWFDSQAADSTYMFPASLLRVSVSHSGERIGWNIEAAVPLFLNLPNRSLAPPPQGQLGLGAAYFASNGTNAISIFPKQAWLSLRSSGPNATVFRLGRFEFLDGLETIPKDQNLATLKRERIAQRLIGNFGFSHVGRSFDGINLSNGTPTANVTLVAARATSGVFDVEGLPEIDVDYQYAAYSRQIGNWADWRLFGIAYHDGRAVLKTDNRSAPLRMADRQNIRVGNLGGHFVATRPLGSGAVDGLLWASWQFGRWGVLTHRAAAIAMEAGYQWNAPSRPWLRAGYFRGSGDSDPADRRHGSFFQILPTPRVYARFPFFNLMNSEDVFLQLFVTPHSKLRLRAESHVLRLSSSKDLWYTGGGAFDPLSFGYAGRPSAGNRGLANLYDVGADLPLTAMFTISAYAGFAQGKGTIARIYPQGQNAKFAYLEFTRRF